MPPRDTRFKKMRRARGVAGDFDDDALELGDVIGDVIGDAVDAEPLYEAVEQLSGEGGEEWVGEDDQEVAASHDKELLDGWASTVSTLQTQAAALAKKYNTANTRALVEVAKRLQAQIEAARAKPGFALEDVHRAEREELDRKIRACVGAYKTMVQSGGSLTAEQERALRASTGGGDMPWLLLAGGALAYFTLRKKPRRKR